VRALETEAARLAMNHEFVTGQGAQRLVEPLLG
jgi:hypothetical protein